jgi:hypothetical protein
LQINVFSDKYKGHCAYVNVQQDRQNTELGSNMPFIGERQEKYDEIVNNYTRIIMLMELIHDTSKHSWSVIIALSSLKYIKVKLHIY